MSIVTIGKGHMIGNLVGKNSSYKPTSPKKCKEKLRKGDISIYDMKNLEFCTDESREAYGGYLEAMHDLHGSDFAKVPDEPEVWARV
ncbi:hypothetical protein HanXRQr2_Chr17g0809041 [Helianthus annuus]|uniref:Uncharacterized protein n=1 Tax=Helianthus annuus TaxID=4232 RepID=A0A9K3DJU0_HELAN|nr:hypothetical protein HanXRQr2_Chr17g0809041 [Helianthus annuus]